MPPRCVALQLKMSAPTVPNKRACENAPQRDEKRLEVGACRLEEQNVDHNLGELREIADHVESPLDVLADLLDEEVVERLHSRLVSEGTLNGPGL